MADEEAVHRCVTKFMLDTSCRSSTNDYSEVIDLMRFVTRICPMNGELFTSGSSAEFHIKPMLPCIGDIDIMFAAYNLLAIPHRYTPPTELPSHYDRDVYACEIIDTDKPGYVYLRVSHILTKHDNGRYVAEIVSDDSCDSTVVLFPTDDYVRQACAEDFSQFRCQEIRNNSFLRSLVTPVVTLHGPAKNAAFYNDMLKTFYKSRSRCLPHLTVDVVACMRCLLWPPQAADWPTRTRHHGWPDATAIDVVVRNGCDVVEAVHPLCRQDEWMTKYQRRLSFSRAEVMLLNSWSPVQQTIYHMLRFVIKHEVLSRSEDKDADLPKLCNYHIKTLMMWECEQKPQGWWSAALIQLCRSLLQKLSDWIAHKHCQHYFISNGNLFDHFLDDDSRLICNGMKSFLNEQVLLAWFVDNYVRRCATHCPREVSVLFADLSSCDKLQRAADALVNWKVSAVSQELCTRGYRSEIMMLSFVIMYGADATMTQRLTNENQVSDRRLIDYLTAVIILRVAYTISMSSLTDDILDMMWTLFDPGSVADFDTSIKFDSQGLSSTRKAITLARLSSVHSDALEMLHNELSKAYLHHAVKFEHGFAYTHCMCVVHVLLAILCYKSGDYQRVVHHCNQVLNQDCSLCRITAEHLPQIDECVDSVLGLFLLYQHVQREVLMPGVDPHQQECKPVFTTQLLALYLYSTCSAYSRGSEMRKYLLHLSRTERSPLCDVLLLKQMELHLDECEQTEVVNTRTNNVSTSNFDSSLLVIMLELFALEKLITFRQSLVLELHSEQFPVLNEFKALYAYKCGMFKECMEMCRNHVNMLLLVSCSARNQLFPIAVPEFLSLLDGELSSLFGIIKLLYPEFILFLVKFRDFESISLLTLSLYLMVQCQKKLRSDALFDTLQLIRVVHDKVFPADNENFADRLILKLTYRSLKMYIDDSTCDDQPMA